jgi:photosystem II stability/assembly factor-like uncharacterized protein
MKFAKTTLVLCFLLLTQKIFAQDPVKISGEEVFGEMRARHIGPALMSGRISDIEGHPKNSKIIYIGTAGGGVWKSENGGVTFTSIFDKHIQSIGKVAIDPTNPDKVIWVGTGETWVRNSVSLGDGIYKSEDGGKTWTNMGLHKSERISGIVINPKDGNNVYAGVLGALWGASEERGVYKTTDGGKTWERILFVDENTGCSELIADPRDPNVLYAAFWEFRRTAFSFSSGGLKSALYKTTDGGKTWAKIHNGFPAGKLGRIAVAVAPSNPDILYAVLETEKAEQKGLYRSDDGGKSWKFLNNDFELTVRPFYFSRIVIDPKNPDIVTKAGLMGSISRDGGKTFRTHGGTHADIHDYWFDINNSDMIYVATDGGLYRSWDGGSVWEMVKNLPLSQFYHVSTDNSSPYNVYGGLQDNGSWWAPSSSPGGIQARHWNSVGMGDGFRVYRHPTKSNIIYSEMQGAENIWRYDTEKKQYKIVKPYPVEGEPKLRFNWNTPIQVSAHQPDRLYVGSQFLHRSEDMGETWVKISPDLTTNDPKKQQQENSGGLSMDNSGAENHCTIFSVAESPLDQNIIWVGTDDGNVQVTTDGGKTWTNTVANVPNLPKNTWAYHVEPSRFDKAVCYVVFDGHTQNDMKPYIYKTSDFGKTWKSLVTPEIKMFARHIKEDLENPNLLFLGTEAGLYVSFDGGQNWTQFNNNVPSVAIHYIAIDPATSDLVLATHGRGLIILDNISSLRQINAQSLTEEVVFLTQKPFIISEATPFSEDTDMSEFVGENPDRSPKVIYHLNKRHTFGKMSMEVFDQSGNRVAELTPGKSKGINIVSWTPTMKMPKVAKGKTFTFGGFTVPRLPAGVYNVRMTKGNKTFESKIELINDPKSPHSDEDRKVRNDAVMQLYNMTENLAHIVDQIDMMQEGANDRATKNPALKKSADALNTKIDKFREKLVVMKGDNYVGSAEPQLREKIAELYSEITNYAGKPSNAQQGALAMLNKQFKAAKSEFDEIYTKVFTPFNAQLSKLKAEEIKLRSFEEFKAADK